MFDVVGECGDGDDYGGVGRDDGSDDDEDDDDDDNDDADDDDDDDYGNDDTNMIGKLQFQLYIT